MFESIEKRSDETRWMAAFVVQQVAMLFIGFLFGASFRVITSPTWMVLNLAPRFSGFVIAVGIYSKYEQVLKSGDWIWILPGIGLLYELSIGVRPLGYRLHMMASEPVELALVTVPALTCFTYSLGIYLMRHKD